MIRFFIKSMLSHYQAIDLSRIPVINDDDDDDDDDDDGHAESAW